MKICMFAKGLPVHIKGGMEIHVQDLVDELVLRGNEVTVITTKHPEGILTEKKENLTIYYVGDKSLKYTRSFFKESAKLYQKLHSIENFDIVHSQSGAGVGYALNCKKETPLIVTFHGTAFSEIKSLWNEGQFFKKLLACRIVVKSYIYNNLFRHKLFLKKADKIVSVSYQLAKDIEEEHKIEKDKIIVIPNGVDINKFKPLETDNLRKQLNINDEKVILSIGAISRQKGFHLLLEIFSEILNIHDETLLVIVGTGPYLEILKQMAVNLGLSKKVIFTGRVPDEQLPQYYNLADICVFPTLRIEGLPLVVLESMACGKNVIASDIGGIPTAIKNNENGLLISPGNLQDLKQKILDLLIDEQLSSKLSKNARQSAVDNFSLERMVDDTIKIYEEFLHRGV